MLLVPCCISGREVPVRSTKLVRHLRRRNVWYIASCRTYGSKRLIVSSRGAAEDTSVARGGDCFETTGE